MLGMDDIAKTVPPILTKIAWQMINGSGSMFNIREIVIVSGIIIFTVNILFKIADNTKVTKHIIKRRNLGCFEIESTNLNAKNWKNPARWDILTIIDIPKIKIKEWKFTNPSSGVPKINPTKRSNEDFSKKVKIK